MSALLRQWWQSETTVRKQDSLVAQLKARGVEITQATLSRYLDPAKPQIAREDVVRGLHAIFGRPEEELTAALDLWERATTQRTARQRLRATAPQEPGPARGTSRPQVPPSRSPRGLLYGVVAAVLVLVGVGTLWLITPWQRDQASGEGSPGTVRATGVVATPAASQRPAGDLAVCKGETCFGLEPNHTVCRTDAVTASVDTDPVIGVELRYSAKCRAAWAKISNTTQGDIARISDRAGRTREYTQISGRDAHTTMLPAARPQDVTACAVLAARTVCATIPAEARD
ncbi:DUF2690 domain-containing protein [Streptomyces sp. NPDC004783]|uniref:DUF2690 domain-containing protein n=1 Tax=Streptomyces sp. NPDC004783 TaxID=3154459 RepID=UPI0033AE1041